MNGSAIEEASCEDAEEVTFARFRLSAASAYSMVLQNPADENTKTDHKSEKSQKDGTLRA